MNVLNNLDSTWYFIPETLLVAAFLLIFIVDLSPSGRGRVWAPRITMAAFALYIGLSFWTHSAFPEALTFHGMWVQDGFTDFFRVFAGAIGLVTAYLSLKSQELSGVKTEYWGMLIGIVLGLPLLAGANHLLMIYFAMELVSILSYILVGFRAQSRQSSEAALKYVLYGATASGVMIYGLSWIFGVTGTMDAFQIREFLLQNPAERTTLFAGLLMVLAGFGYKIAAVPFHMWAPDVYQGAPTPVTAFFAVGPKAAGFAILIRFIVTAFTEPSADRSFMPIKDIDLGGALALLSALTMTLGNVLAVQQTNIKRFLAYSSIAHAGYLLMAAAVLSPQGISALLFYLIAYFVMNVGAFAVTIAVINSLGDDSLEALRGLGRRGGLGKLAALAMVFFMVSLIGLPPTLGFVGKFYLFRVVLDAKIYWLAIFGILNSVIGLYYYARVIKYMYFDEAPDERPIAKMGYSFSGLLILLSVATLGLGLYWGPLAEYAQDASQLLMPPVSAQSAPGH